MNGLRDTGGRPRPGLSAEEAGFTLVEMLVAMLVSIIVLGGVTLGIATAFRQNTEVTAHATEAARSEAALERLVLDLRQAVNGSCGGGISGVDVNQSSSGLVTTISLCAPSGALSSLTTTVSTQTITAAGITASAVPVVWICNTGSSAYVSGATTVTAETCARTVNGVGSITVRGVTGLTLRGLVNGSNTPSTIASPNTTNTYTLNPAASSGQTGTLSWVGINVSLVDLQAPTDPTDLTTVSGSSVTPMQTGTGLLNYGT